jgi:Skp family chaperone for outer membrane proteins
LTKKSVVITAVLYGVAAGALAHAQAPAVTAPARAQAPAAAAPAPAAFPTRIAIINLTEAMMRTKEGQKAGAELNNKFGPKKAEFDKRQADIEQMTDRLNKGRATMSDDAQKQLNADIAAKSKDLKRFGEDSQAEMDNDEAKITQDLQTKMSPILTNYAIQNNFAVVLDIGQQSPVLWYASATNVTDVMVALYDQAHPVKDGDLAAPKPAATAPPKPTAKK